MEEGWAISGVPPPLREDQRPLRNQHHSPYEGVVAARLGAARAGGGPGGPAQGQSDHQVQARPLPSQRARELSDERSRWCCSGRTSSHQHQQITEMVEVEVVQTLMAMDMVIPDHPVVVEVVGYQQEEVPRIGSAHG